MTETVPVEAPERASGRTRVVAQTRRGWLFGHIAARILSVWPLVALERGWGVGAPVWHQLFIVPIGLAAGALWWRTESVVAPRSSRGEILTVGPSQLEFAGGPDLAVSVVDRGQVGLIDVDGGARVGSHLLVGYDHSSRQIFSWHVQWSGWKPERVVKVLCQAGYPARLHRDIYDGTFQAQLQGTQPRAARSLSSG